MSRRQRKYKKHINPDVVHEDVVVSMFINRIMYDGKKNLARRIVYGAMDRIKDQVKDNSPLDVFKQAIENVKPAVEVRSRRVGGANFQVPVDVRPTRRLVLALRWLTTHSRQRGEKTMTERVAGELLDAYNKRGQSIKKKEDVYRMADANRAFSHFNW